MTTRGGSNLGSRDEVKSPTARGVRTGRVNSGHQCESADPHGELEGLVPLHLTIRNISKDQRGNY